MADARLADYYILNWSPKVIVRIDMSSFSEEILQWLTKCKDKYTWDFINREDRHSQKDNAVDLLFEAVNDASNFTKDFTDLVRGVYTYKDGEKTCKLSWQTRIS